MPSEQFIDSILANLRYWQLRTATLDSAAHAALAHDRPNLVRALRYGLELPAAAPEAAELAAQSFPLVEQRGQWIDWVPMLERAIAACGPEQAGQRCALLDQLGQLRRLDFQLEAAIAAHREAEALAQQLGDDRQLARVRFNLSEDYRVSGDYAQAEACGQAALEGFARLGLLADHTAAVLNTLGLIAYERADYPLALERLRRAAGLWDAKAWPLDLARTLNNLANTLQKTGADDEALGCFVQARELAAATGNVVEQVTLALSLGTLYDKLGRHAEAEAVFRRADTPELRRTLHPYYRARVSNNLGDVLLSQGRPDEAHGFLEAAVRLWEPLNDPLNLANTLVTLAEARLKLGQQASARAAAEQALGLLRQFPGDALAERRRAKAEAVLAALTG